MGRLYVQSRRAASYRNFNWTTIAALLRGKARLSVFLEIGRPRFTTRQMELTAMRIRKNLRDTHPMSLNLATASLRFLLQHELIVIAGYTWKRDLKHYQLSQEGERVYRFVTEC